MNRAREQVAPDEIRHETVNALVCGEPLAHVRGSRLQDNRVFPVTVQRALRRQATDQRPCFCQVRARGPL